MLIGLLTMAMARTISNSKKNEDDVESITTFMLIIMIATTMIAIPMIMIMIKTTKTITVALLMIVIIMTNRKIMIMISISDILDKILARRIRVFCYPKLLPHPHIHTTSIRIY